MVTQCPLSLLEVVDAQEYRHLKQPYLQMAQEMILKREVQAIVLPEGRGLGRFLNLIHYDLDNPVEYVDQAFVFADQLIHLASHLKAQPVFPEPTAAAVLASECLASSFDLLLLGQFAQLGREPEFLQHHLESISYYFECYEHAHAPYKKWLTQLLADPFQIQRDTALFLFDFCWAIRSAPQNLEKLNAVTQAIGYPLCHHFNCANWALFSQRLPPGDPQKTRQVLESLLQSEADFIQWFCQSH